MKTFRSKLILMLLSYSFLIAVMAVGIIYNFTLNNVKTKKIQDSIKKADYINDHVNRKMETALSQLNAIKTSEIFTSYLQTPYEKTFVNAYFIGMVKSAKNIMQLRFIDTKGQEQIRIDRKNYLEQPTLIEKENLQNKSQRYYFKQSMLLQDNAIWFSNVDLNIENGHIEKPIKPVLRIATTITMNNQKQGILIINIFMEELLKQLVNDPLYNIYIIDNQGNYLVHIDPLKSWTKYLNHSFGLKDTYPKEYEKILSSSFFEHKNFIVKNFDFTNGQNLKIIIEPKRYLVYNQIIHYSQELIITLCIVLLLSFPLAYMFSRHPNRLKEQVDQFNVTLENKIKSRTRRLHIANEKLHKMATLDFLTNIPNRRYFFTMGDKLFESAKRGKMNLCLIILDIDFFKNINDTYGHKTGDKVLKLVANTLQNSIRKEDIVARVGGEEFAIILNDSNKKIGQTIAEKIRKKIEQTPYKKDDVTINLTSSFGITEYTFSDEQLRTVYERADQALYVAKDAGRNCIKIL